MLRNIFKIMASVKSKLFFGFFSMAIIIALLGGYAFTSMTNASDVVEDTYDRPLMAINFARSASQVFSQLELAILTEINASKDLEALSFEKAIPLLEQFKEDLEVAQERSISPRAETFFDDIYNNLVLWEGVIFNSNSNVSVNNVKTAQTYANIIEEQLDIIVELQMNESFRARESSIKTMNQIRQYNLWAVGAALGLTLLLSGWVAVTIIRPLKAAALAAEKISSGDFNTDIPTGGDDETGVLLNTMAAMQESIRNTVDKEQNAKTLAQQRLSESLRNSKDAILLTNSDGIIIVSNPRVKAIFPCFATKNLENSRFTDHFHEDGYSVKLRSTYFAETSEISFEDGRWARVSASKTQEGGSLYIWSDITEVKKYAEELTIAKEEAEAADKAKTLFLAAMSHELRTPLNAVIGFSDALQSQFSQSGGNPNYTKMVSLISQSGAQLLNIVKDILIVADNEDSNVVELDKVEIDMSDIVNASINIISMDAEKKNVRIIWNMSDTNYAVFGDESHLQRLLLNLLSNAIKYNSEGGVVKITLTQAENNDVRMDVIDNGIGIDEANIQRVMKPFVQVDEGHTRKYDGVGVGLTVVNKIINAHEGRLKIRSKLGKGTCVSVYLPRRAPSQSNASKVIAL